MNPSDSERCALSQHPPETVELTSCHLSKELVGKGCATSLHEFKIQRRAVLILVATPDSISLYSIAYSIELGPICRAASNGIAFLAQILSLHLLISVDKLAGMLPSFDCLPYNQAGGMQQNIVLERGMLTAVWSIEPPNQCNKFSFVAYYYFADTLPINTYLAQNWYPVARAELSQPPASKLRRSRRSEEKLLTFFVNYV
ncbi:MAG TPA: hypothetical protein VJ372_17235 [Pyrinomonadaceae bacterium]|nr:hypothetical protein [Pyrinomonadaceae bacterium]